MSQPDRFFAAINGDIATLAATQIGTYDGKLKHGFEFTALMYAAFHNKAELVPELIEEKPLKTKQLCTISINVQNKARLFKLPSGSTALDIAILTNSAQVIKKLMDVEPERSSLYYAVVKDDLSLIDHLLSLSPSLVSQMLQYRDKEDMTPVTWAAAMGRIQALTHLYDCSKKERETQVAFFRAVAIRGADGFSALDHALDVNAEVADCVHRYFVEAKEYAHNNGDYVIEGALKV